MFFIPLMIKGFVTLPDPSNLLIPSCAKFISIPFSDFIANPLVTSVSDSSSNSPTLTVFIAPLGIGWNPCFPK